MNKLFKKEVSRVLLGIVLVFALMPVCAHAQNSGSLTVWSFTNELRDMINNHYKQGHSKVKVTFAMTPNDNQAYQKKLDPLLASGKKVPDVFALEAAFVRKYVESGQLLELTDIYMANRSKLMQYTVDVGTYNGRVYALSWQAAPGAMFYRRSLAKKYLGTDDPKTVQTYFADINKFLDTAKLLKLKSNGACVAIASSGDLYPPYLSGRSSPWIVNGKLVIDPMMERYLDMAKTFAEGNYHAHVGQWSNEWYAGMRGELKDGGGKDVEVFAYFLPTWGLDFVLKANAPATAGDWAMIPGPIPYSWGGTWLAAWKNTPNPAAAKEMIRYFTTDDDFMELHARATGDLVSNQTVVDRIKGSYAEPFLGNQNHYAEFAEMAKNVNGKLLQGTDRDIDELFNEALHDFVYEGKTMKDALAQFTTNVENLIKK
ncbi:MAG: ABC transporter substrate-binding protein [Treponema sp.]|nr:ABC transporter substrate-binding protein [Treponema sp.]